MADFVRPRGKMRVWVWRGIAVALLGAVAAGGAFGIARLENADPTVDISVIFGTVTRGAMVREVSGRGPLVPVTVTVVAAQVSGQIVQVLLEPGVAVEEGTALVVMTDPTIERNLVEARRSLKSAEAERDRFKLLLAQQELDLRATTAQARAAWEDAKSDAEMKAILADQGLISEQENRLLQMRTERSWALLELQLARVENTQKTSAIQVLEKDADVARANDDVADRQRDVDALTIRATASGILQELGPSPSERWEVGQRVMSPGTRVAKITDPHNLKAVIAVPDLQAREVIKGQSVEIDMLTAEIPGRVVRIDPAVKDGHVEVDVELLGELPSGARPDLEVTGTIEIERLEDVLQLRRLSPALARTGTTVGLFRVTADGKAAEQTEVRLGRTALTTVEIVDGLQAGDRVIVSDMRQFDGKQRVLLPSP